MMSQEDILLFTLGRREVGTSFLSHSWLTLSSKASSEEPRKSSGLIIGWVDSPSLVKKLFSAISLRCFGDYFQFLSWLAHRLFWIIKLGE
ncbi:hypothetical protein LINGRAHAP2_LOCUS20214 [Linum grandiflorum]